jgi:hypothetical protein
MTGSSEGIPKWKEIARQEEKMGIIEAGGVVPASLRQASVTGSAGRASKFMSVGL